MKVGYARVSSSGQSLDVQVDTLKNSGCEKIFQENSGFSDQLRDLIYMIFGGIQAQQIFEGNTRNKCLI